MLVVWKAALVALVGLCCCCCVSSVQQCSCMDRNSCIASNGTVSTNSSENNSTNTCRGDVMCCGKEGSSSAPKNSESTLLEPKVAAGGGCGRKRFPPEGEKTPSNTTFYGDAPWAVKILNENSSLICSGSLISPRVVLTAAHCIISNYTKIRYVRSGEYVTTAANIPLPAQTRSVYKLIRHPEFNEKNISNDIALIVLEQPMELNAIVDVICTPEEGQEVITTECFVTGYGYKENNSTQKAVFKKMKYARTPQDECLERLKTSDAFQFFYETNICGTGEEGNSVTLGDGGGALFCPSRADPNRIVQVGIVSWLTKSIEEFPTIFTSVEHYLPWLKDKLKEIS